MDLLRAKVANYFGVFVRPDRKLRKQHITSSLLIRSIVALSASRVPMERESRELCRRVYLLRPGVRSASHIGPVMLCRMRARLVEEGHTDSDYGLGSSRPAASAYHHPFR